MLFILDTTILFTPIPNHFPGANMTKTVSGVIASIPRDKQIRGMTREEFEVAFMLAGYGLKRAKKNVLELIASARIQSDLSTNGKGAILFWAVEWPAVYLSPIAKKLDPKRIGAVYYADPRHMIIKRSDGRVDAWNLQLE